VLRKSDQVAYLPIAAWVEEGQTMPKSAYL
jgi:hypothetical protein